MDQYVFKVESNFKVTTDHNEENVLLILDDPNGNTIIIQKKLNLMKEIYAKTLNETETLRYMHELKFNSWKEDYNGYEQSEVELDTIGSIYYTKQSFNFMYEKLEMTHDMRIIQLSDDYYAIYSFDKMENMGVDKKAVTGLIQSLNEMNFPIKKEITN